MTESEAEAEASRRNFELGARGDQTSFWVAVEEPEGWTIERRSPRQGLIKRIWNAWLDSPGP